VLAKKENVTELSTKGESTLAWHLKCKSIMDLVFFDCSTDE